MFSSEFQWSRRSGWRRHSTRLIHTHKHTYKNECSEKTLINLSILYWNRRGGQQCLLLFRVFFARRVFPLILLLPIFARTIFRRQCHLSVSVFRLSTKIESKKTTNKKRIAHPDLSRFNRRTDCERCGGYNFEDFLPLKLGVATGTELFFRFFKVQKNFENIFSLGLKIKFFTDLYAMLNLLLHWYRWNPTRLTCCFVVFCSKQIV